MPILPSFPSYASVLPLLFCVVGWLSISVRHTPAPIAWNRFKLGLRLSWIAALLAAISVWMEPIDATLFPLPHSLLFAVDRLSALVLLLIAILGSIIGRFSARYLQGESKQTRYVKQLFGVLACVQVVLLANHWVVLILAWAGSGFFLRQLLCFYSERPFARLAVQKKTLADRVADLLLIVCAVLIWHETRHAYFHTLASHLQQHPTSWLVSIAACCLVLAVVIRTALMPVHGWLTQVMEAPTPVSALLHAGVVNLGGYVFLTLWPLLNASSAARWLLLGFGLFSALAAALVMLTRISIKVKLAWSTIAQMGFMMLECALGLYSLAALHLLGHSLYKTYAFLSASSVVQATQMQILYPAAPYRRGSVLWAPVASLLVVFAFLQAITSLFQTHALPLWWALSLAMAWSPLLWIHADSRNAQVWQLISAFALLAMLTCLAALGHGLPIGLQDQPFDAGGWITALGLGLLYITMACIELRPQKLETLRRWVYAGFYLDEYMTRLTLSLYPGQWAATTHTANRATPSHPEHTA